MADNKITFNPKWLKAAAIIAARNDIRYYLNGVLVEVYEHEARLVATDGHRMVIFRKLVEGAAPTRLIVPTEIIGLLRPSAKHPKIDATISYDPSNAAARATLDYLSIGFQFTPIDGKFPEYAQVMNKASKPSGVVVNLDITYLADFQRCVQIAFGEARIWQPSIRHNGQEPAAVTFKGRDDFFGLIMPRRMDDDFKPPAWTLPVEQKSAEPALA